MILRTYICESCNHTLEVELRADQWNMEPPSCPQCVAADLNEGRFNQTISDGGYPPMQQEFKQVNIGGSVRSKAVNLALDIAEKDYGVADLQTQRGAPPKVRYKDQTSSGSSWGANHEALEHAAALGRETRLQHGSSLDIIKQMPDLIELSKRRSMKVW